MADVYASSAGWTFYLFDVLHCQIIETAYAAIQHFHGCLSHCVTAEELCTGVVYLSDGSCYYFNISAGGLTPTPQPGHGSLGDEMVYFKVLTDLALCEC